MKTWYSGMYVIYIGFPVFKYLYIWYLTLFIYITTYP